MAAFLSALGLLLKPILEVFVEAFMKRASGPKVEEVKDADPVLEGRPSTAGDLSRRYGDLLR
jgi:hypothetical protein